MLLQVDIAPKTKSKIELLPRALRESTPRAWPVVGSDDTTRRHNTGFRRDTTSRKIVCPFPIRPTRFASWHYSERIHKSNWGHSWYIGASTPTWLSIVRRTMQYNADCTSKRVRGASKHQKIKPCSSHHSNTAPQP
jgi:hypothetical protein